MVGVTHVHPHGEPHQFAAEVVLEAGADELLPVVQVLRADEPDHCVDEQGFNGPGDGVCAHFQRLLIDGAAVDAAVRVC